MNLEQEIYCGPPIDDQEVYALLPKDVRPLIEGVNGTILFEGGLHIRGAVRAPAWHSLRHAWLGEHAVHRSYPDVLASDVPFAQGCAGDQFLCRDGEVLRLFAEDGFIENLGVNVIQFLDAIQEDPIDYLQLYPLLRFMDDGGQLAPGQVLVAYPPLITKESAGGNCKLHAVAAEDARSFHAELARQLQGVVDGARFEISIAKPF